MRSRSSSHCNGSAQFMMRSSRLLITARFLSGNCEHMQRTHPSSESETRGNAVACSSSVYTLATMSREWMTWRHAKRRAEVLLASGETETADRERESKSSSTILHTLIGIALERKLVRVTGSRVPYRVSSITWRTTKYSTYRLTRHFLLVAARDNEPPEIITADPTGRYYVSRHAIIPRHIYILRGIICIRSSKNLFARSFV